MHSRVCLRCHQAARASRVLPAIRGRHYAQTSACLHGLVDHRQHHAGKGAAGTPHAYSQCGCSTSCNTPWWVQYTEEAWLSLICKQNQLPGTNKSTSLSSTNASPSVLLEKSPAQQHPLSPSLRCSAGPAAARLPAINRPHARPLSASISGSRQQLAAAAHPPPRSHDSAQRRPLGQPRSSAPTEPPDPGAQPHTTLSWSSAHRAQQAARKEPAQAACPTLGMAPSPSPARICPMPEAHGSLPSCALVLGGSVAAGSQ